MNIDIRQKVWLKAYIAYTKSDKAMKTTNDAEAWANDALKSFDKTFKTNN